MGNSINAAAAVVSVAVQELPDIYLEATPNTYTKEGLEFVFYCKSQNMGGLSVEWDFGDGQTASSIETSHAFPPGEHTIKAKITNSQKTQSWDKEITILSEYPEFDIDASPPSGPSPLKVTFNPILTSTNLTANGLTFRWTLDSDNVIEEKSFWRTFATVGGHTVFLRVVEPGGDVITLKSVNIIVNTPELTISDGGRKIHSDGSIFVDPKLDPDKDGINQPFEDEAMVKVNPNFELDEDEDWLKNSSDHVANFVRITPYPSVANPEYVLFIYVIAWSRDYGRYPWINYEDHNGDREKVIMAWETIDTNDLELKWVYTSAHGSEACSHSAVWAAWGETTNIGKIWGDDTENMTAALKFEDNHLKLQVSEDKHAIYPTEACGEGVKLAIGGFGEDCGGGLILNFTCYNAGEPDVHLMDDISFIFPNENIWSGNKDHPDKFCGGLEYSEDCPGTLGGYLQSENILNDKLK
jgi:PKD repeat protein